jgi:hypothetical protein
VNEAAFWTFVGMRNKAVLGEGASDPISGGSAIWAR